MRKSRKGLCLWMERRSADGEYRLHFGAGSSRRPRAFESAIGLGTRRDAALVRAQRFMPPGVRLRKSTPSGWWKACW